MEFETDAVIRRSHLAMDEVRTLWALEDAGVDPTAKPRSAQLAMDWSKRAERALEMGLTEFEFCVEEAVKCGADRSAAVALLRRNDKANLAVLLETGRAYPRLVRVNLDLLEQLRADEVDLSTLR